MHTILDIGSNPFKKGTISYVIYSVGITYPFDNYNCDYLGVYCTKCPWVVIMPYVMRWYSVVIETDFKGQDC